ncbi:MAG TPA: hypothetical protein VIE88_08725, partial [Vicinamibacteria bacterium]
VAERSPAIPPPEPEAPAIPEILQELNQVSAPASEPEMISFEQEVETTVAEPPLEAPMASFGTASIETVQEFEDALNSLDSPLPETPAAEEPEIADVSFAQAPEPEAVSVEDVKHVRVRSNIDILAELEKLRKDATAAPPAADRRVRRETTGVSIDDLLASSLNHRKEISRIFEMQVPKSELSGGHQIRIGLQIEDREQNPVGQQKSFSIELHTRPDLEKLLLSLKFHIFGK